MSLRRVRRLLDSGMFVFRQAVRGELGENVDWIADRKNISLSKINALNAFYCG